VECQANHVDRARVLIGWQSPTHVCQPFTRQTRVCQHEKIGENVGENRDKFYLSPTVCQRVCRLFLRRSHTLTWVCQHEFANFSFPCEGRFRPWLVAHISDLTWQSGHLIFFGFCRPAVHAYLGRYSLSFFSLFLLMWYAKIVVSMNGRKQFLYHIQCVFHVFQFFIHITLWSDLEIYSCFDKGCPTIA